MTRISRDWTLALSLTLIAFLQRVWALGYPKGFIFDEIYYAKNANSLVQHGVELDKGGSEFVVHPPVGKWLIGIGIKIFGFNEFGWRIAAAVIGSLSVTLMYFTAKKLFNSEFISISAAFLILVDGLHLVHSRVALLDIFLMFFIQIAVLAILHNKYWFAGFALGLACATKWSGLYFLVALGLLVLTFDWLSHRYLGHEKPLLEVLIFEFPRRFLQFGLLPIATYLASWIGWFFSDNGWGRNSSPNAIKSLWNYHSSILDFHASLTEHHPYMSNPWSWIIMGRPTSFYYETPKGCGSSNCSQEVLALGTPLLYWSIAIALMFVIGIWIQKRDLTAGILLTVVGAGYLPWFFFQQRTMFTFYVISFEPFLILILVYLLNLYLKGARDEGRLKYRKNIAVGIGAIYLLNFIYFLPLYYGTVITYNSWLDHMWLTSWI
jgi:dolichyl-phosphate-mannose--protein O-mannosyl transferase